MSQQAQPTAPAIAIERACEHAGRIVTIRGWLYNLRESGKLLFPIFRDGSGTIQGVVAKNAVPALEKMAQDPDQPESIKQAAVDACDAIRNPKKKTEK